MLDWRREKGHYPEEDRFKFAAERKEAGNKLFKEGNFKEARE
jgi:hypothetical protein